MVISASGRVMKINRQVASKLHLQSHVTWVGKHVAEVFGPQTPYLKLFEMWTKVVATESDVQKTIDLQVRRKQSKAPGQARKTVELNADRWAHATGDGGPTGRPLPVRPSGTPTEVKKTVVRMTPSRVSTGRSTAMVGIV